MAKRKTSRPSGHAQPARILFTDHLSKWQSRFRARAAKIATALIRTETGRTLRAADAVHAAHPGACSESFHAQYRASLIELVALQQMSIAEGRAFRESFTNIDALALPAYLGTQSITPAWLVGFSNDEAARKQYENQEREARAARMSKIAKAPRPGARGKSKRSKAVHQAAQKFYTQAMEDYRDNSARFWRWKDFAPKCIAHITQETSEIVREAELRRSILPAKKYPRPK